MDRRLEIEKEDMIAEMKTYLKALGDIRENPFYHSCDTIHQLNRNICMVLVNYCNRFNNGDTMDVKELNGFLSEAVRIKSILDQTAHDLGLELKKMIYEVEVWLEKREKE